MPQQHLAKTRLGINFYQHLAVLQRANVFKNGISRSGDFGLNVQGNNGWNVQMAMFVYRAATFIHSGCQLRDRHLNVFIESGKVLFWSSCLAHGT